MQEESKKIPLRDIVPDPNQPRKHFDEVKLGELAHSISQYGVILPIMVRPVKSRNKGKYQIVVGERRFKAAGLAMLEEIPCVIRILTDEEALEVQITENLQREDVNPMEEAESLNSIIKRGLYKPKELAARLGKRKEYILQRVKLCELIPEFQELVYADRILMTQANQICRFSQDVQIEFYKSYVPDDWQEQPAGWKLREIHFGNTTNLLDDAPFKTEDPTLNPKMGVCHQCKFNSKVSELLFDDHEGQRICSNPSCYEIKVSNDFKRKLDEVAKSEEMVFVAKYTYGEEATRKLKAAEETGKPVLRDGQYQVLKAPQDPGTLEQFRAKFHSGNQDDHYVERSWEDARDKHEVAVKDYGFKLQHSQQAFVVTGYQDEGKIIDIYIPGDLNAAELGVKQQIEELRKKDERSEELAKQKFFKDLQAALASAPKFVDREDPLELTEQEMLFTMLVQLSGYKLTEQLKEDLGKKQLTDVQLIQDIIATGRVGFMHVWIRRMALEKLCQVNLEYQHDAVKSSLLVMSRLADRYIPHEHARLIAEKNNKRQAQKDKMNEKIASLQQTEIPAA